MEKNARIAAIRWYGPFTLEGGPQSSANERLVQFKNAPAMNAGLYMFVGRRKRRIIGTLFQRPELLYVGKVSDLKGHRRTFLSRFKEHLAVNISNPSSANKLWYIENIGEIDSIWVGLRETSVNLKSVWSSEKNDIEAMENLLIHMLRPPLCDKDLNAPNDRRILLSYFDTTLWNRTDLSSWRPTFLPDLIDFDPTSKTATLTWTSKRKNGVKPKILEEVSSGTLLKIR
ncbi:hypothetical protein [Hyphococcus sp.]|uniref:hypothetical protein n=1 Tax=Hyphococcus sp. TaxID=2038636 RepID=UPI003D144D47